MPEFIDPVFTKTSPKRSFSLNRKRAFWLVFAKTGSIISGTGKEKERNFCKLLVMTFPHSSICYLLGRWHVWFWRWCDWHKSAQACVAGDILLATAGHYIHLLPHTDPRFLSVSYYPPARPLSLQNYLGKERKAYVCSLLNVSAKYTVPKIWCMYSQKWNWVASFPIPTFMYLWAIIYSQDRSAYFLQQNR